MEPKNEIQLIQAVGEWAHKNFEHTRHPALGVAEEIGEAIHCVLKRKQMIRGFDKEEFFLSEITDAWADCIIYLCDWCSLHDAFFTLGRNMQTGSKLSIDEQDKIIIHLLQGASSLLTFDVYMDTDSNAMHNLVAQRIANGLEWWAAIYKVDLRLAVAATWAEIVSKRDWIKDPVGTDA